MKQYLYDGKVITASSKEQVIKIVSSNEKIIAKSKEHLKELIGRAIIEHGNDCDLNFIDTSRITNMAGMFYNSKFNGDISKWNVSKVRYMSWMFAHSKFNGDISKWDVGKVKNMGFMFYNSSFNGDISKWFPSMKKNGIRFNSLHYPFDEDIFSDIEV